MRVWWPRCALCPAHANSLIISRKTESPVGSRYKRTHGKRGACFEDSRCGSRQSRRDYKRPGSVRQTGSRSFPGGRAPIGRDISASVVVGDSVWDLLAARRARALGVGLLSGGYGTEELEKAGAYRVYKDPADMLQHLDEVGVRTAE